MLLRPPLAVLALLAGCAGHYAYDFRPTAVPPDRDVAAAVHVDPVSHAVVLDLTNHTDQVVQVQWPEITLARPDGKVTSLRPERDLGWIQPGATVAARLAPFALADDAASNGRLFHVDVPMIVRREGRTVRFTLAAYAREL